MPLTTLLAQIFTLAFGCLVTAESTIETKAFLGEDVFTVGD
jgi:hypothetical protein